MSLLLSLSTLTSAVLLSQQPQIEAIDPFASIAPSPTFIAQASSDPTVLAFQTDTYSIRIFAREQQMILNVFDRQNNYLLLRDIPVVASANSEGYTYVPATSEAPSLQVFQSLADTATASFTLNNKTEIARAVTVATVPPLDGAPPTSVPPVTTPPVTTRPGTKVVSCMAFPDSAYIYRLNGRTLMDITNWQSGVTWLQSAPVSLVPSSEGTNYTYSGDTTVEVFTSAFDGSCAIAIDDNEPEFGTQ